MWLLAAMQEELVRLGAEASLLTGSDGHDETSTLLAQGEEASRRVVNFRRFAFWVKDLSRACIGILGNVPGWGFSLWRVALLCGPGRIFLTLLAHGAENGS